MIRKLLSCTLLLILAFPTLSQSQTPTPVPIVGSTPALAPAPSPVPADSNGNEVEGLKLPEDTTVKFDEGFVRIKANCNGEVKWLVLSALKVKYLILPLENTIIVSVPPQAGTISIYAVGLVGGKLTEFAKSNITITGGLTPVPVPNPNPSPSVEEDYPKPWHVTFVMNLNESTPDLGQILTSQNIKDFITNKGGSYYRQYDYKSPVLKEKGLSPVIEKFAKEKGMDPNKLPPMIIVQASNGKVKIKDLMPKTEAEVIQYLTNVFGVK